MYKVLRKSKFSLIFLILFSMTSWAQTSTLETITLENKHLAQERVWDGVIEAVNQATLSAQTGGRISHLSVDVDDYVEEGSVILRFTDTEQKAGLEQAQSKLIASQSTFQQLQAEYDRIKDVFSRKLVSKSVYDQAISQRDTAKANVASATAAVKAAQEKFDYTVVKAPFSGIVTERFVQLGETINPGQALIAGISLNKLRVKVDLPQSVINLVRKSGHGEIILAQDQTRIAAESITIFPYADPQSKTFRVRLNLPNIETGLYPGMWVKTAFVIGTKETLMIPQTAMLQRSELRAAYVIDESDKLTLRQIRPGQQSGNEIEVLSGLEPGDKIAVDAIAASIHLNQHKNLEKSQ